MGVCRSLVRLLRDLGLRGELPRVAFDQPVVSRQIFCKRRKRECYDFALAAGICEDERQKDPDRAGKRIDLTAQLGGRQSDRAQ